VRSSATIRCGKIHGALVVSVFELNDSTPLFIRERNLKEILEGMSILRGRVSVVVVHKGRVFLPGGLIESGETPEQAAIRESLEETGYVVEVNSHPRIIRTYHFEWDGCIHHCETIFLAGNLKRELAKPVNDAAYHRGVEWVPVEEVARTFAYHADILEPVQDLVKSVTGEST
jgi:tRNA(adenine34) deaminase